MENIVKKYFDEYIKKSYYYFAEFEEKDNSLLEKEGPLFYTLMEELDEKELDIVLELLSLKEQRLMIESETAFKAGFKTAIKLMNKIYIK